MPKFKTAECENVHTQLTAYFDNQIPMWKRHLMQQHLNRCPDCASRSVAIQQTDKLLRFIEPVKASDTFLSDVMLQASKIKSSKQTHRSLLNRFGFCVENLKMWIRSHIRAYNPVYMFGLIFGVFTMIAVTLYSPRIEKFDLFPQFHSKTSEVQQERFIAFEVILQQEPKRSLKIR